MYQKVPRVCSTIWVAVVSLSQELCFSNLDNVMLEACCVRPVFPHLAGACSSVDLVQLSPHVPMQKYEPCSERLSWPIVCFLPLSSECPVHDQCCSHHGQSATV